MSIESAVSAGRRLIATTLLDRCSVQRPTRVSDGGGGRTVTWATVATNVACRFGSVVDPQPGETAETIYSADTAVVMLPLAEEGGPVVHEQDRITNLVAGDVWVVIGDKTAGSALAVVQRILVRRTD